MIDKLILGANPISGVDHFLSQRARERSARMHLAAATEVIEQSWKSGARGFTFSPTPFLKELFEAHATDGWLTGMNAYPLVPNLGEYWPALMSGGVSGMASAILKDLSWGGKAKALLRGGATIVTMNPLSAIRAFLAVELDTLERGLPEGWHIRSIILNETATDFSLALGTDLVLREFAKFANSNRIIAGFQTRNFVRLANFLESSDLVSKGYLVMAPFNPIGFQMTPSRDACERAVQSFKCPNLIAISVLAAGQVTLRDAVEYLRRLPMLPSVAVGVSRVESARETFDTLQHLYPKTSL